MLQVCCLNRLSLFRLRRLMGGFAFRLPWGWYQLYMWVQMGRSAARWSEVRYARA